MNTIEILDPSKFGQPAPPIDVPRCSAECQPEAVAWRRRWKGERADAICGNKASVRILGKNYCKKHAGGVLMDLMAEGKLEVLNDE